jgi:hypothetical protein
MGILGLKKVLVVLGALAILGVTGSHAYAIPIVWDLSTPAGPVNSPHTYLDTTGTYAIVASGFSTTNAAPTAGTWTPGAVTVAQLFGKVDVPTETGLGLNTPVGTPDFEIQMKTMIQLDLADLIAKGLTNPILSIGSLQAGEAFAVFGSNTAATTAGATGTLVDSGTGLPDSQSFALAGYPANRYDWITATSGDVVILEGFTAAAVPEPGALLVLGSGLVGVLLARRRKL